MQHYLDHDEKHHIFVTFIFYHREVLKQDHYTFIELYKNRFVMKPLQNPPLCSSTLNTVHVFILLFLVFVAKYLGVTFLWKFTNIKVWRRNATLSVYLFLT
jgi:hypothetical protein